MQLKIPKKWVVGVGAIVLCVGMIAYFGKPSPYNQNTNESPVTEPLVTATITVKAGYYPQEILLPANRDDVVLRFVTKNTYDCSASLLIAKLGIERLLPPTGNTDVLIPKQEAGTVIQAGCSMGMYSFKLKFI